MDFFNTLSDDQFALIGCAVAFCLFGGLMSLSYYVGSHGRSDEDQKSSNLELLKTTDHTKIPASSQDDRKAA
jgi:hypothetical protein